MKCCDTCVNFVLMPGVEELPAGKGETIKKRWGWCNAPLPPWAETFLSVAGREVSKTYTDSGTGCDVHVSASAPSVVS